MICFSVVLWPITCCLTFSAFFAIGAIHSPKVPRSGSENQCSHQDNLCPWSYYIYVGAKAVEFKASTCHCYLLFYWNHQPLAHPYLHSGIYVWIHKDWTIGQLVTDVFPTLKHCYLFSTSLLPLTTLLSLASYPWDFFSPRSFISHIFYFHHHWSVVKSSITPAAWGRRRRWQWCSVLSLGSSPPTQQRITSWQDWEKVRFIGSTF